MTVTIKNWRKFQHYDKRRPPWIKLHSELLENREWRSMTDASKGQLAAIWLLASRLHDATGGDATVPNDPKYLSDLTGCEVTHESLQLIESKGFISLASDPLALCVQDACLETETETEFRDREKAEEKTSPEPSSEPFLEFETVGKVKSWTLTVDQVKEWKEDFPSLDVEAQCRQARAWLKGNPTKRKTSRGMPKFLVGWLGRSQNRGGGKDEAVTQYQRLN